MVKLLCLFPKYQIIYLCLDQFKFLLLPIFHFQIVSTGKENTRRKEPDSATTRGTSDQASGLTLYIIMILPRGLSLMPLFSMVINWVNGS
ncbi:hypothetical protein VNO78_18337 [Psophocarpus tetragonolobus]|uniref:Uncharacterized protein n=1 Tax=Psophocarpus tetragonolobus TaxID=3891 RepID=A0AAN9XLR5_PSOTE